MGETDFYNWLMEKHNLTQKSARDVLSRVKRAGQYVDLKAKLSNEELVFKLSQNLTFQHLKLTVKSQLRRAIHLLKEFESGSPG